MTVVYKVGPLGVYLGKSTYAAKQAFVESMVRVYGPDSVRDLGDTVEVDTEDCGC